MPTATDNTKTEEKAEKPAPVGQPCRCFSVYDPKLDANVSCGATVFGKREFKPGHDAKYKSALLKAFRDGNPFVYVEDGTRIEADPMELAKARGWEKFMTPAKKKAKKAKTEDTPAETEKPAEPVGFQPARFKVGRSMKDGSVVSHNDDDTITVSYLDKANKPVEVTLAKEKVQLG